MSKKKILKNGTFSDETIDKYKKRYAEKKIGRSGPKNVG